MLFHRLPLKARGLNVPGYTLGFSWGALWTVGDIRLPGRALNFRGKHATLKSTFWQDAHMYLWGIS
jgi:hypothetical protein